MTEKTTPAAADSKRVQPFTQLGNLRLEIDNLFRNLSIGSELSDVFGVDEVGQFTPNLEVLETDKTIKLSVELPGVDEADIDVTLEDETLTISGEKKSENEETDKGYYRCERTYGSFSRFISVPAGIDEKAIHAKFDNGVLNVTIQKPAEAPRKTRKVPIKK